MIVRDQTRFWTTAFGRRLFLIGTLPVILLGCAPSAPQMHVYDQLPLGADPDIYVTAALQKDTIVTSLRNAGFHVVDRIDYGSYLLRATVGIDQGEQPCGTLNNVRYELRSGGKTLVEVKAKGWTGNCQPNVFDAVSREMRQGVIQTTVQ